MMQISRAGVDEPDLRVGNALPQPLAGSHFVLVQFVLARLDIDGGEFVAVCVC